MTSKQLATLCDLATEAHAQIQRDFQQIDPIVGVSQGMRKIGVPADAMTIDCLRSGKRIIIILHDEQPEIVRYQFSLKAEDLGSEFEEMAFDALTATTLYDWIKGYF